MPLLLLPLLLLATVCTSAAEPDDPAAVDALFAALARPVPTSTPFVEERRSALLETPLLLHGLLERPATGSLLRSVQTPYRERTTVQGDRVTVEREGQRPRSFSLRRSPELAAVLASFRAMLDGDRRALDPHYAVTLHSRSGRWTLRLEPRQPRLRQRLGDVTLFGSGDRLDCIVTAAADGQGSRMLVGDAATAAVPEFDRHCGND